MNLFVDNHKTDTGLAPDAALSEVLGHFKQQAEADGRIIVGVVCDGIDVSGDEFAEAMARPGSDYTRVDLHTARPDELVRVALSTAGQLLDASAAASTEIAEHLSCGRTHEALPRLSECCRAWAQVNEGVRNAAAMLGIDAESFRIDGQPIAKVLSVPLDQLKQIKEVIEASDFVLLSDILNYEFGDALDAWRKVIDALAAEC